MIRRAQRILGWAAERLLGIRSPSLSAMKLRRTFRFAWTGRLEDCARVTDYGEGFEDWRRPPLRYRPPDRAPSDRYYERGVVSEDGGLIGEGGENTNRNAAQHLAITSIFTAAQCEQVIVAAKGDTGLAGRAIDWAMRTGTHPIDCVDAIRKRFGSETDAELRERIAHDVIGRDTGRSEPDRVRADRFYVREGIARDIGIDESGEIPILDGRQAIRDAIAERQEQQRRAVEAAVQDVVDETAARIAPDLPPPKFTIDQHRTPDRPLSDRNCPSCGMWIGDSLHHVCDAGPYKPPGS